MSDLIKQLEDSANYEGSSPYARNLYRKAVDEIERLTAEDKKKSKLLDDMHIDRGKLKAKAKKIEKQNTIFSEELAAHLCDSKLYHVTEKEISKLWGLLWRNPEQGIRALELIHIFKCEECKGMNMILPCPGCASWGSEGWVYREDECLK